MKLEIISLLIPLTMAVPCLMSAQLWLSRVQHHLKSIIANPIRRSAIPQFMLDARHPWVLENQRKLEGLPNASDFLCAVSPSNSTVTNETTPRPPGQGLEIPPDLFENLEINNNRYGISRPGWPNALGRLNEMKLCPRALAEIQTLEVDIYIYRDSFAGQSWHLLEPSQPSKELLDTFGDVLESMTSLETLKWAVPEEETHFLEEAFIRRNLSLPSVKRLEPGVSNYYLVAMCPNLEILENGARYGWYHNDLGLELKAASMAPRLKRFASIGGQNGWTPSLVSDLVSSIPQIESLGLLGSLGRPSQYTGVDTGDSGQLKAILDVLSELRNLTHLDLPGSESIGVGFNGGPGCGNVYLGKEGWIFRRQITQESAEATEKGGKIVLANLPTPTLKSFAIGGQMMNITRNDDGELEAIWPWTGRMEEWLMEVVPDRRGKFGEMDYDDMW